jgi:hypothetical protein
VDTKKLADLLAAHPFLCVIRLTKNPPLAVFELAWVSNE